MKYALLAGTAAVFSLLAFQPQTHAEDASACTFTKAQDDFEQPDIDKLYECVKDQMKESYGKQGHEIGSIYTTWKVTATGPANPGTHGNRFLLTYANDIAFDEYVKYQDEGNFSMPVGSILAKESYKIDKEGKPRLGPLLIMTKLEAGKAAEYGDWLYSGVNPAGKEFKISQSFCHDCHGLFEDQDSLGYPDFDVRLKAQ